MKRLLFLTVTLFSLIIHGQDLTQYVNPFIGTASPGNTNPGAVRPWGMTSVSPFNSYDPEDKVYSSVYIHGKKYISGFSHLHLSGPGCSEMGVFVLMPTTGNLELKATSYWSEFSDELASPGYYACKLNRYNTRAEVTTTTRTSICRFTFPGGVSNLLVNTGLSLTKIKGGAIRRVSDTEVEGFRMIGGFCGNNTIQTVYFVTRLSKQPVSCGVWNNGRKYPEFKREIAGEDIGAYFTFQMEENETLEVKTGISFVSIENARLNLDGEQPAFDFEGTRKASEGEWNKELSRIRVEGGTRDEKTIFYTALYHTLIHPNIFNDINGEYVAYMGDKILKKSDSDYYTFFHLWGTNAFFPMLSLVYPNRQLDMVRSMLSMYETGGWLPKLELAGMENYVMVGDPAIPVITDTYFRGIRDFDADLAYEAMKHNATVEEANNPVRPGLDNFLKYGYIPEGEKNIRWVWGSVSTGLEYCIADWNLAQMAKALGKEEDYRIFHDRSMFYKNYFDTETGFIRPRMADGKWFEPFSPAEGKGGKGSPKATGFVEGNSWQYTFVVPYDIPGLIKLMGGPKKFTEQLTTSFDSGYFFLWNEPDMAYPFLFNYVKGEEWRTQKYTRESLIKNYSNAPRGIPGNEDCGQLSAWLVFAMMGFYPDCIGNMDFQIASPYFEKITITLDPRFYNGQEFVIEAKNAGKNSCFIESMKLNGKTYKKYVLNHQDIVKGGKLSFVLKENK